MNIYSWVRDNATNMPDKVCVQSRDRTLDFGELHRCCNVLGTSLRAAGISRGDRVTIVLPNMPEFVISYMAIVGIGAVAVLVNPAYTSGEMAHILKDSGSKAMILEDTWLKTYETIKDTCPLDTIITTGENGTFNKWVSGSAREVMAEDMEKDDTAVMIYSSGLTGYPMGAMLTHGNLDHQSDLMRLCMDADHTDTTLTVIPCFHSFSSAVNMLSMLRYGGSIYLMRRPDFKEMSEIISSKRVTSMGAVPTLYYGMIYHPDFKDTDCSGLKTLIAGGSALDIQIYKAFKDRFHLDIRHGYGITEASPTCAVNNKHIEIRPESIGPCVPGVKARVVDDSGADLAAGEKGELIFKGPNIMKGYFNKPEETKEAIRDGWLYTGDLGYIDKDGYIYITGYKKDMIITSGFNVYSKEVVDVLNSMPGIGDSAITGIPDLVRGAIIKAYIVRKDPDLTLGAIKGFTRNRLARFKTPRKIVFVDEIPRDDNNRPILDTLEQG